MRKIKTKKMTNKTKKSMQTTWKHMSKIYKEIYKIKLMMNKTQSIQKIKMITLKNLVENLENNCTKKLTKYIKLKTRIIFK